MFERAGKRLDWWLWWPVRTWRRWRIAHLQKSCQHPSWRPAWGCWPWQERCARCYLVRQRPEFVNAKIKFEGFKTWDSPDGFTGYGPVWRVERSDGRTH